MDWKQEIIDYINSNNLGDVINSNNSFYDKYKRNLYCYIRVSTEGQEFSRQVLMLADYLRNNNLEINIKNIYCDKFTGKSLARKGYLELKDIATKDDYIIVSEISRIGRSWDAVKQEWYRLKANNIGLLVMDFEQLSSPLPNEERDTTSVDKKFIQELIFDGILYASCKKIEEVSRSTKAGLDVARSKGIILGRPTIDITKDKETIDILSEIINGKSKYRICRERKIAESTLNGRLKKLKKIYNTEDFGVILEKLKKEEK